MATLGGASKAAADPAFADLGMGEHTAVDWQPLRVAVVQPRMRGGHTEYKVLVFDKKSGREVHHCRRRFNDFIEKLTPVWSAGRRRGISLPPLPSKRYFGRFERGFLEQRRVLLQQCMQAVREHPRLAAMPEFEMLTEVDAETMATHARMLMDYRLEVQKEFFASAACAGDSAGASSALADAYVQESLLRVFPDAERTVRGVVPGVLSGALSRKAEGRIDAVAAALDRCRKAEDALKRSTLASAPPPMFDSLNSTKGLEDLLTSA